MGSLALLGAVALAVLTACGGGGDDDAASQSEASAAASNGDGTLTAEHGVAPANQKVLAVGGKGFVAQALAVTHTAAAAGNFDVLVVGDADKIDAATKAQIQQALDSGKQVVIDGPSDGSSRVVHNEILREITGLNLDAAAVRIQKDPKGNGYYVTPIDSSVPSSTEGKSTKQQAGGQQGEGENTIAGIFGSGSDE